MARLSISASDSLQRHLGLDSLPNCANPNDDLFQSGDGGRFGEEGLFRFGIEIQRRTHLKRKIGWVGHEIHNRAFRASEIREQAGEPLEFTTGLVLQLPEVVTALRAVVHVFDPSDQIRLATLEPFDDSISPISPDDDVRPSVGQLLDMSNVCAAPYRPLAWGWRLGEGNAESLVLRQAITEHLTVSRFKDMQRENRAREKDYAEGEDGEFSLHAQNIVI